MRVWRTLAAVALAARRAARRRPAAQASFHLIKVARSTPGRVARQLRRAADVRVRPGVPHRPLDDPLQRERLGRQHLHLQPSGWPAAPTRQPSWSATPACRANFGRPARPGGRGLNDPGRRRRRLLERGRHSRRLRRLGQLQRRSSFESRDRDDCRAPVSPGGITAGKAIRGTITPGCSTLLEARRRHQQQRNRFRRGDASRRATTPARSLETACNDANARRSTPGPVNPTNATSATFTYHFDAGRGHIRMQAGRGSLRRAVKRAARAYSGPAEPGQSYLPGSEPRTSNGTGSGWPSYPWTIDTTPPVVEIMSSSNGPGPGEQRRLHVCLRTRPDPPSNAASSRQATPDASRSCPSAARPTPTPSTPAPSPMANGPSRCAPPTKPANQSIPGPFPLAGPFELDGRQLAGDMTPPETTIVIETRPTRATAPPPPSPTPRMSQARPSSASWTERVRGLRRRRRSPTRASPTARTASRYGPSTQANIDPTPAGYSFDVLAFAVQVPAAPLQPALLQLLPETRILARPPARTADRTPTFRFGTEPSPGASFQCAAATMRDSMHAGSPFTPAPLAAVHM